MKLVLLAAIAILSPTGLSPEQERAAAAAGAAAAVAADAAHDAANETDTGSYFDSARDADADVAAALARAQTSGRMVMIVLGGDWCHDSRALASHFEEGDFDAMLRRRYEVVMVDVGHRDRNLQIPARYGVATLTGTPTVLIVSPDGQLLNRGTAASWRNAASRSRQTIYSAFANFRARPARR